MNYHIGEKIRYIRESKGLSVPDVSAYLGMKSQNAVLVIESGRKSPQLDRLEKIAKLFEMTVLDILSTEIPEGYIKNNKSSLLGKKIAQAREELGQSLEALAEATNISEKGLEKIEKGSIKKISDKQKVALGKALNLRLEYLIDDDVPI